MNFIEIKPNEFINVADISRVKFEERDITKTHHDKVFGGKTEVPTGERLVTADVIMSNGDKHHLSGQSAVELRSVIATAN